MAQDIRLTMPAARTPPPPAPLPVTTQAQDPAGIIWDDPAPITLSKPTAAPDQHGIIWDPPSSTGLPQLPEKGPAHPMLDVARETFPVLGALMGATEMGPVVKGLSAVPRILGMAGAAGMGAGAGRVIGDTLAADPNAPPKAIAELPHKAGVDAAAAMAGEGVPAVLGTGFKTLLTRRIASAAQRGATPAGREAVDYVSRIGGNPRPGMLAPDSSFIRILENIFEGAPASRGPWKADAKVTEDAFARDVDRIIGEYGGRVDQSDAGQVIKDAQIRRATDVANRMVGRAERGMAEVQGPVTQAATDAAARAEAAHGAVASTRGQISTTLGAPRGVEPTADLGTRLIKAANDAARKASSARYNAVWQQTDAAQMSAPLDRIYARAQQLADEAGEPGLTQGVLGRATGHVRKLTSAAEAAAEDAAPSVSEVPGLQQLRDAVAAGQHATEPFAMHQAQLAQELLQEAESIAGEVSQGGGNVTPRQLNQLRSLYGRMSRESVGNAKRSFAILADAADRTLTDMLGGADSPLRKEYDVAKNLHKQMIETFEEGALAKAAESAPKDFLKWVTGQGTGSTRDILRARQVLSDNSPEVWKAVQAQHWASLSQMPDGTPVTPRALLTRLQKVPIEQLRAIYGDTADTLANLKGLITTADDATSAATAAARAAKGPDLVGKAAASGAKMVAKAQALNPYDLVDKSLNSAGKADIIKLRTLVGEEGWKKVQARKLEDWLTDKGGAVTKDLFAKLPPKEQLQEIFPADQANFLYQFARVRKELVRESSMGGTGKMWIQLATPAAAGSVAAGIVTGNIPAVASGTAIILTPRILAKIATSPEMRRALITGMKPTVVHTPGVGRPVYQTTAHLASMALARWLRSQGLINADGSPAGDAAGAPPPGMGPGPNSGPSLPTLQGQTPGRQGGPGPRAGTAPPPGL